MTLMNLHDTWNHWPEYGIRDSRAAFLDIGPLIRELDYAHPGREKVTTGRVYATRYPRDSMSGSTWA